MSNWRFRQYQMNAFERQLWEFEKEAKRSKQFPRSTHDLFKKLHLHPEIGAVFFDTLLEEGDLNEFVRTMVLFGFKLGLEFERNRKEKENEKRNSKKAIAARPSHDVRKAVRRSR